METPPLQHDFHPVIASWFAQRFPNGPTPPQRQGWPVIRAGHDALIAAPTGSGKTLTAFLVCIDRLIREASGRGGTLPDECRVLYVSPLKALATDVRLNLEGPLAEIAECAATAQVPLPPVRVLSRSGDSTAAQRVALVKKPPHIVVTTPESLYLLLTSTKGRQLLRTVDTVIVDEIHALARDKRGSHLALSLERLDALVTEHGARRRPQRIGLSATQRPMDAIAQFLVGQEVTALGSQPRPVALIDTGHLRTLDLAIEVPESELSTVCSAEQWQEVYERMASLVRAHQSTLIFVNTRKLAERVAYHLGLVLGEDQVASHHGSLSKERRLAAEARLKAGQLKAIVATASLELGIDVGAIDLVCQVGSPRSIAGFLQRVGRAGHSAMAVPKGRLFVLTRDELIEGLALIRAVRTGDLDAIVMPVAPIDILAQHIIAETAAAEDVPVGTLLAMARQTYPYRDLSPAAFEETLSMVAGGFAPGKARHAYVHYDRLSGRLRSKRGARLAAATSGGAIPEQGDFRVVSVDDGAMVGTVNEDFALESAKGDVFLLGTTSWQIEGVRGTDVLVRDLPGAPPTIPFWLGEAPGRTPELSAAVSQLRADIDLQLAGRDPEPELTTATSAAEILDLSPPSYAAPRAMLEAACGASAWASVQAVHYIAVQKAALGLIPTRKRIIFERFFDVTGGMQLVIHAPFGMRITKGFGLALRKRFCRSFDFELQASADDDGIVLSLGPQHSFPIEQLFKFLNPRNVRSLLEQAILQVPLFQIRWRWNTTRALAVLRQQRGQRVPPALQRFRADDLMTAVFPAQTQCQEHVTGDIPIPDHPLVRQTMHDCLHEAIDLSGLTALLEQIERGEVELIAKDTREPSPFAYQLLNASPYAFLDDAPLEERRARTVTTRRHLTLVDFADLTQVDREIALKVSREAWPDVRGADDLHDVLTTVYALPESRLLGREPEVMAVWFAAMEELVAAGRASRVNVSDETGGSQRLWCAAELLPVLHLAYPSAVDLDAVALPPGFQGPALDADDFRAGAVKGLAEITGVLTLSELSHDLALDPGLLQAILIALEAKGDVVRGHFLASGDGPEDWCDRRLLQRIHKLTLDQLRNQVRPVTPDVYWAFLCSYQHLLPETWRHGPQGLLEVIEQLEGLDLAVGAFEAELLPSRLGGYQPAWLDSLGQSGAVTWGRLTPPREGSEDSRPQSGIHRGVPLSLMRRDHLPWLAPADRANLLAPWREALSGPAQSMLEALTKAGAQFPSELVGRCRLLPTQADEALGELARIGLAASDGFASLRPFLTKTKDPSRGHSGTRLPGLAARFFARPTHLEGGRWALFGENLSPVDADGRAEAWACLLLRRYGIVWRDLLWREAAAPPWSALARVYRRLEARGEIRGGRFIHGGGMAFGEQFALPEAAAQLRQMRDQGPTGKWVVIAAADPVNLLGIVTPGPKIASSRSTLIALMDGQAVATADGGEITWLTKLDPEKAAEIRHGLMLRGIFRVRLLAAKSATAG